MPKTLPKTDTLLDSLESTVPPQKDSPLPPPTRHYEDAVTPFRHSGWKPTRTRIIAALQRQETARARTAAFIACSSRFFILRNRTEPHLYKLTWNSCHDRLCRPCQAARQTTILRNLTPRLTADKYRLLTLTLKSSAAPLKEQLDRLYRCFRHLRRAPLWKKKVTGGAAFLEITRNTQTGLWHPHLHCILEGTFLPKEPLSTTWLSITGDSYVTDIRLIRSPQAAARYVAKYLTKTFEHQVTHDPAALDELVIAIRGRKLLTTFGQWHKWSLTRSPEEREWEYFCELDPNFAVDAENAAEHDAIRKLFASAGPHRAGELIDSRAPPPQ